MHFEDVKVVIDWERVEGWNPGLHDRKPFFSADPEGFFKVTRNGDHAGFISAVAYDDNFGFIGLYIVKPELRGHRVGLDIGECALDYLWGRNIGVEALENKVSNYEVFGFKPHCRTVRYEGVVSGEKRADMQNLKDVDFELLEAYDSQCFPAYRTAFLKQWISLNLR